MPEVRIIKADGRKENFDEEKLRLSISRAGVPERMHQEAVDHIRKLLYQDMPTAEIYKHILEYLGKSSSPHSGSRYSLKQAIMDLGPTGFPFERFIAAILIRQGFKAETDIIMNGLCVSHEVDVLAEKDNRKIMIECKFHNRIGTRTDVKVALYVMARYQDLTVGWINKNNASKLKEVWLVTNTKCTTDAIAYAQCMGIKIVSWGYPDKGNLQDLIEKDNLHPITVLSSLSSWQKHLLLNNHLVLCRDLLQNSLAFDLLKLTNREQENLRRSVMSFATS